MKTYVGFIRDHSGSMSHLANQAKQDFNENLQQIKDNTNKKHKNIISVVECGTDNYDSNSPWYRTYVSPKERLVDVNEVAPLVHYPTPGGTPLFDSVGELITQFESIKRVAKDTSFLVVAITDGQELHSRVWGNQYNAHKLAGKIKELQDTGRWTFVFRVPFGYKQRLINMLNLPADNVVEWEQTTQGFAHATKIVAQGFSGYYDTRSSGGTATRSFFTSNLNHVSDKNLKASLVDVKDEVKFWNVKQENNVRDFCEMKSKKPFIKGAAFYQLEKTENKVQTYKKIAIREKLSGAVYVGDAARDILGLPKDRDFKLKPGDHGKYDVYIQSTSVNRKLPVGTNILYWENAGISKKKAA